MQVHGPAAAASGRKPRCSAKPDESGFAEVGSWFLCEGGRPCRCTALLAVMDAQSQGHIPIPGKRNFPIDSPSKEVCPSVGRSAQPLCQSV